ncbi:unnamed protein product [Urochloa decumbens]|uniref:Response regulatory domain-containing protein n=1 Tax=Urochloa decumbens TaxID=240449 RepID=A0ABC9D849_9POAL
MGTQRTEGLSSAKLSVLVVDEDLCHANLASCILAKHDFQVMVVMVYTSPTEALKFLKDHEKDIDFALVAVNMKEMHGFQFVDICRESHKDLQLIMMSVEIAWPTVKRCVELGARFLVKKPLDANTISDIWQHLDNKFLRWEKIKYTFQGIEGRRDDVYKDEKKFRDSANKQTVTQLIWTPFLQRKFLEALELLGEAATPKMIQLIMNVNFIDRKQISTHLQKHRKKIKKQLRNANAKKYRDGSSSLEHLQICETDPNTYQYDPKYQPADRLDADMFLDQIESSEETQSKYTYEAMRRALKFGIVFDESQLLNDPPVKQASKGEVDMIGDGNSGEDWTYAFSDKNVVSESHNAGNANGIMEKGDPNSNDAAQAQVFKLVAYSDSEDGEEL